MYLWIVFIVVLIMFIYLFIYLILLFIIFLGICYSHQICIEVSNNDYPSVFLLDAVSKFSKSKGSFPSCGST